MWVSRRMGKACEYDEDDECADVVMKPVIVHVTTLQVSEAFAFQINPF